MSDWLDPDWRVREAGIVALARAGGPRAILFDALDDPHHQVRAAALDGIDRSLAPTDGPRLGAALARARDAWDRARLVRLLGIVGVDPALAGAEATSAVGAEATAWQLVLARAGELDARRAFARRLRASREEEQLYAIGDVHYLARRLPGEPFDPSRVAWLAAALAPLLLERGRAVYLGDSPRPGEPESLRTCDLAVRTVVEVTGHAFSFDPAATRHLPDEALGEVARWVRPIAAAHRALFDDAPTTP